MTSESQAERDTESEGSRTGWASLAHRDVVAVVAVLAGGVALYAMNLYFTAALMPSVVGAIGGERYYAWAATGYLIVAVVATMLVSRSLARYGARRSYLVAFVLFGLGTLVSALSPTMLVFVAGRALQGAGAGLLIGLGFAVIRSTLPADAWSQAASLVSAMFAVGALLGPARRHRGRTCDGRPTLTARKPGAPWGVGPVGSWGRMPDGEGRESGLMTIAQCAAVGAPEINLHSPVLVRRTALR